MRKKILYVAHNHPSVRPGGAEAYALELYESMRDSAAFNPLFLAKAGPPISKVRQAHGGTLLGRVNADPNQYFLYTEDNFDWFNGVLKSKEPITHFFREFLEATRPDLVHFQHTLFFGFDMIQIVRQVLPHCPIVYTLHEYLPICHRQGQMLRMTDNAPCLEPSPRRCQECFPQFTPQDFFLRKKLVQSHFSLVDLFIAPSRFLRDRFVDWGIPSDRIVFEEYGRRPMPSRAEPVSDRPRNRFAFFGQINPFKGVDVLLEAMALLAQATSERSESLIHASERSVALEQPHLWVYGANLDLAESSFRDRIHALLAKTRSNVSLMGRYEHRQLPSLMAEVDWVIVPSIWWENSPLVIQEAFGYGRPVICSDIGGMAEKVTDSVNGLHFRAGDAASLARKIEQAVDTPDLWDRLRKGISKVHPMQEHREFLENHYDRLLGTQTQRGAQ